MKRTSGGSDRGALPIFERHSGVLLKARVNCFEAMKPTDPRTVQISDPGYSVVWCTILAQHQSSDKLILRCSHHPHT